MNRMIVFTDQQRKYVLQMIRTQRYTLVLRDPEQLNAVLERAQKNLCEKR